MFSARVVTFVSRYVKSMKMFCNNRVDIVDASSYQSMSGFSNLNFTDRLRILHCVESMHELGLHEIQKDWIR